MQGLLPQRSVGEVALKAPEGARAPSATGA